MPVSIVLTPFGSAILQRCAPQEMASVITGKDYSRDGESITSNTARE